MERYNNAKIYKIVDNTNSSVYIGSTCVPTLALRLARHRLQYKSYLKGNSRYYTSFKILENNDYSIVLLEDYPCETKDQLLARERYYIENNICVNKIIPTRTPKEYREKNKDKIQDYIKKYYKENQDKLLECKKEYYEQNKDSLLEKNKNYYEQNKDKINERRYKHFTCECGGCYIQSNKSTHLKSIKHQNYLNNIKTTFHQPSSP